MRTSAQAELLPPPLPDVAVHEAGSSLDISVESLPRDIGRRPVLSIVVRPSNYRPASSTFHTYAFDIAPQELERVVAETFDQHGLQPLRGHEDLGNGAYRHQFPVEVWKQVSSALEPYN